MHNEVSVCGVIKAELLRGANTEEEYHKIDDALTCFDYLSFLESDWGQLAKFFITLKKNGIAVPFQDGIIAYLAIKNDCSVWTNDNHFKLIQVAKPELKLF